MSFADLTASFAAEIGPTDIARRTRVTEANARWGRLAASLGWLASLQAGPEPGRAVVSIGADDGTDREREEPESDPDHRELWEPGAIVPTPDYVLADPGPDPLAAGIELADRVADSGAGLALLGCPIDSTAVDAGFASSRFDKSVLDFLPAEPADDWGWIALTDQATRVRRRALAHPHDPETLLSAMASPVHWAAVGFIAESARRHTGVILGPGAPLVSAAIVRDLVVAAQHWWIPADLPTTPAGVRATAWWATDPILEVGIDDPLAAAVIAAELLVRISAGAPV